MTTAAPQQQLIYFISGMWCSTCAKNICESISQIEGIASVDLNYASKLLVVKPDSLKKEIAHLDQSIQAKVHRIGFGIKKQSDGWILNFHEKLQKEAHQKISWTQVSLVWFFAMWSSMLAFASYTGGDLTQNDLYTLALISSAFGLPAILIGIIPYARSGLRALWFSQFLTLDFFIFIGGCSAMGISVASLMSYSSLTYADSGSMIIAILLLTKKIENTITTSLTANILYQLHPQKKEVEAFKKEHWKQVDLSQIKKDDLVRIPSQETIPFDGILESSSTKVNNHLMNGENFPVELKKGDHIFAGAIAQEALELSVSSPLGERKIDTWAEAALLSKNHKSKYTKFFSRIESSLVIIAFGGAFFIASFQYLRGFNISSTIESFFVGILIFCPCLFASIIPLAKQMAHLALSQAGLLLQREDALLDLSSPTITHFYFDKTGTLEAVESTFISQDIHDKTTTPYLKSIAEKSKHVTLRGLNLSGESQPIQEIHEIPGKGLTAKANDGTNLIVGTPRFLEEKNFKVTGFEPTSSLVAINQKIVGQIMRTSLYNSKSQQFLKKLLKLVAPTSKIDILSGDPNIDAGGFLTQVDPRISYQGQLSPQEKAHRIKDNSVFVGDGLNDTLALSKARVSFRMGHRIQGFAPVDFHLQTPNLDLILIAIQYAKKYRRVLIQTGYAALTYNILTLSLAALGKFSPLGAVLSMLASFSLMLLSVFRLYKIEGVKK